MKVNFSEFPDDKLAMLWVDLNRPDAADQLELLRDEISKRVDNYVQVAETALQTQPPDYDDALENYEKAQLLNNAPFLSQKIQEVENKQRERQMQIRSLSFELRDRLIQREDMNKLKKAVNDAEKLKNDGLLVEELKGIYEEARKLESENRETTGQVTTKGRTGNMMESKEGYDFLLSVKEGKTNRSEVWDALIGAYVAVESSAFESLLKDTRNRWKEQTEGALQNFKNDPKGDYLLHIDMDPTLVEASFERHFGHSETFLVHPDCYTAYEKLKKEIDEKAQLYRAAQALYEKALASKDPIDAYEQILDAISTFKLDQVKEATFRKRAQNFAFGRLKQYSVHANELIERFDFDEYQTFSKNVWDYSTKLANLQQRAKKLLLLGAKEIDNYADRLATYQEKFVELEQKYEQVKKNYGRINSQLKTFEENILDEQIQHKIDADEWWNKLTVFLENESETLGDAPKEKFYFVHFRGRIEALKRELIPLQSDQKQLELMRTHELEPEKWPDILSTNESLRATYPEAAEIYSRVFIKSNKAILKNSLLADDFITARQSLHDLYQHDDSLVSEFAEDEKQVKSAEETTTREIQDFFARASLLANSSKTASMIESWKMHQHLVPEFRSQDLERGWPSLAGKCIYTGIAREKISALVDKLNKESQRVTERVNSWTNNKLEDISEETLLPKKGSQSQILENDPEFVQAAADIRLLRENHFLTFEQIKICKSIEFRRAKWLADQHIARNNFSEAVNVWNRMKIAYPDDDSIEKEALLTRQKELLFQLTKLLENQDYQGAVDRINDAEQENIAIVAQHYEIRLKHALAFEGLKQYENALRKLDDIKPDLLKLSIKEIKIIELERDRLQIGYKIDQTITKYKKASDRERERYRNSPSFFSALLVHLVELKKIRDEYPKHLFVNRYFQQELSQYVNQLEGLIDRNRNISRDEVRRDVFLYRLTLREFKTNFSVKVDENLIKISGSQKEFNDVCNFIRAEFARVNPAENNQEFDLDEAERLASSLSARDLAELMHRYCEQFNQLLKFESNPDENKESLSAQAGEAIYMFDKLMELCERSDVETSWEYTLRNGYTSRAWEVYFNGKNATYETTIPRVKKHITFIQRYLNAEVEEIKEFNQKLADAEGVKPEIEAKINEITYGYSAYLDQEDNDSWNVSTTAQDILAFRKAISEQVQKELKYIRQDIYPVIIGFYNRTIAYTAINPEWSWKGFEECIVKAKQIEQNAFTWANWSLEIQRLRLVNDKAYSLATWVEKESTTVPWQNEEKRADVNAQGVIPEKQNWYPQVFLEDLEKWKIISPEGETFDFKYRLDKPLPTTYQMWLWQNAQSRNEAALETLYRGPEPKPDSQFTEYPAYALVTQRVKSDRQEDRRKLSERKREFEDKIVKLEQIIKSFPTLPQLDNWLRQGQLGQLRTAIDKGKEIGARNKQQADYLRAKEADLVSKEKGKGRSWPWFR